METNSGGKAGLAPEWPWVILSRRQSRERRLAKTATRRKDPRAYCGLYSSPPSCHLRHSTHAVSFSWCDTP